MTRRALEIVAIFVALALGACGTARSPVESSSTGCTSCHGQPPASGAHLVHTAGAALQRKFDCSQCHKLPQDVNDVDHILRANGTAVPAPAEVRFDQQGALAGATEAGGARAGAPAFDKAQRTCSNVYCHGATLSGAVAGLVSAPNWDSKGQIVCGSCHGIPPADARHAGITRDANAKLVCVNCHAGAIDGNGVPAPGLHVNGTIELPNGCSSCHGDRSASGVGPGDPRSAPPVDLAGRSDSLAVGAHQAHLTQSRWRTHAIACADCHTVPQDILAPGHIDSSVTVPFGDLAKTGATPASYDAVAHTCSNVYCHGGFPGGNARPVDPGAAPNRPAWDGGSSAAACGTCHGIPPPAPQHPAVPTGLDCGACHVDYTATSVNKDLHINGIVDRIR
jgi:predicted CxxxxCH...CXXCH cytochrome family protein